MSHLGGPWIQRVSQPDQPDAQHDDGPPPHAVGEHAERPDQEQAHELRDSRKPARNRSRQPLVGNAEVFGEDVRLGKIHVRHHADADQRRVHVGPEVHDPHPRRQLDSPDAPSGAATSRSHSIYSQPSPPSYPSPRGLLKGCSRRSQKKQPASWRSYCESSAI